MVLRAAPLAPAKGADGATRSFLTFPWACDQTSGPWSSSCPTQDDLLRTPTAAVQTSFCHHRERIGFDRCCRPRVVPNSDGSTARSCSGARARRQFLKDQLTNDQGLIHGPTSGQNDPELSWTMCPYCSALSAAPHASTIAKCHIARNCSGWNASLE
jgi:hypothetical protein